MTEPLLRRLHARGEQPVDSATFLTTFLDFADTGILDVFDRYNFTVNEAEPLEVEVAVEGMAGGVVELKSSLNSEGKRQPLRSARTDSDTSPLSRDSSGKTQVG